MDHDVFEQEFALESLESDRLRVTILIGAIISSVLLVVLLAQIFSEQFQTVFHGNMHGFLMAVGGVFGVNVTFLIAERIVIGRLIKNHIRPSSTLKYISAFLETSIPTTGIIVGSLFLGPIYTLFTPAAFI
jgi:hypothetical protein